MIDKRKLRGSDIHNLQMFFNASRAAGDNRRFLGRINKHYDTDSQEIVGALKTCGIFLSKTFLKHVFEQ